MTEAEARPRWREWFTPTGAPPAWGLVRYLVCGLALGIAFSAALPHFRATLLSALTAAIVAAASSGGPSGIARRLAFVAAAWILLLAFVGYATGGHPVWAAVAMAAVAFLTSIAGAAGPLGVALGFLLSLGYLLVTAMARVAHLHELVSLRWAAAHLAVGCLAGLCVALVGTAWRRRGECEEVGAARAPIPLEPI